MVAAIDTMAYAGVVPWHGLGTKIDESDWYDLGKVRAAAGLNWDVGLEQLVLKRDGREVPAFATVREDTRAVLGVVGPVYKPLQNSENLNWFQPFLDARQAQMHTAGSLHGGAKVWALAKINRAPMEIVKGDVVDKYLLLSNSHDGTTSIRVGFTPIRVVCANTLHLAHGDKGSQLIRVRHTKSSKEALDDIRDVINTVNERFEATAEQYRSLARKEINQKDLQLYVSAVFGTGDNPAEFSTRTKNIINEVMGLAETGKGNDMTGVRGTLWAAYNGVTQYLAYDRGRNADTRLSALWWGEGANINRKALEAALAMAL